MSDQLYFKVTNGTDTYCYGEHKYQPGLNIFPDRKNCLYNFYLPDICDTQGFYFCTAKEIPQFYPDGCHLWVVEVPPDAKVDENKRSDKIIMKEKYPLADIVTYDKFSLEYPGLSVCLKKGFIHLAKILINNGANVNESNGEPIRICAKRDYLEMARYLVEYGADVTINDNTAVRCACRYGRLLMVKFLEENGADIHACGDQALINACDWGHLNVVQYLVENGADITANNNEPFVLASENGNLDVVKYLLEKGFDLDSIGADHMKDIMESILSEGFLEVAEYLVSLGADIMGNIDYFIARNTLRGLLSVVKYLVELGANIHSNNDSAVRNAATYGKLGTVKYLVELGADIRANNDDAIKKAFSNDCTDVVKYIISLDRGSKLEGNALIQAMQKHDLDMVRYLVGLDRDVGIDIHLDNEYAVNWASGKGYLDIVKELVRLGADIKINNDSIKNAYKNGHHDIVAYLEENGADTGVLRDIDKN